MQPAIAQSPARLRLPLVTLLSANALSQLGSMVTLVALPWFVLQTTGSASKAGMTMAVNSVPILLAGVFGGLLVDRLGFKRSSVLSDLLSALFVAAIPLLFLTGGIAFWQLLLLVFFAALVSQPGRTARVSLLPAIAAQSGITLVRVNSLAQAMTRMALLLGPPVAGILVAVIGASNVLWIDAASFLVSAGLIGAGLPRLTPSAQQVKPSSFADLFAGLRHIRQDSLLLWVVITVAIGSLVSEPLYEIVYPVYARDVFDSATKLGLMYSALAAGSLLALALYSLIGARLPVRLILIGGFGVRAATICALVALPSLPLVIVLTVLNALCFEPLNPIVTTLLQQRTPEELRGRVFGMYSAIGVGTLPLGTMIGGFLLSGFGLVTTLAVIASASVAQTLSLFAIPAFRHLPAMTSGSATDDP